MSELLTRARSHILQMAPHQRDRTQGQLLIELADEVERLQGIEKFVYAMLDSHSIQMTGMHSWRFRNTWPLTSARGPSPEAAVASCIEAIKRSAAEMAAKRAKQTEATQ